MDSLVEALLRDSVYVIGPDLCWNGTRWNSAGNHAHLWFWFDENDQARAQQQEHAMEQFIEFGNPYRFSTGSSGHVKLPDLAPYQAIEDAKRLLGKDVDDAEQASVLLGVISSQRWCVQRCYDINRERERFESLVLPSIPFRVTLTETTYERYAKILEKEREGYIACFGECPRDEDIEAFAEKNPDIWKRWYPLCGQSVYKDAEGNIGKGHWEDLQDMGYVEHVTLKHPYDAACSLYMDSILESDLVRLRKGEQTQFLLEEEINCFKETGYQQFKLT